MRRVLAIAGLAVRTSIRSRLVVALLVILMAAILGLPLTVQSDGTPEGYVRIVIGYTMGLASLILSLTALWSGALSIAREVDDKQIQMMCSKPVHRVEIWLGKWLGLGLVHAALLAACAGATLAILHLNLRGPRFTAQQRTHIEQDVLTARQVIAPQPLEVEAAARAELQDRLARDPALHGLPPESILDNLRQELLARAHTLGPGQGKTWTFALPPGAPGRDLRLAFRFSTSRMGGPSVRGTWRAGPPDDPGRIRMLATNTPDVVHQLVLPATAGSDDTLLVTYLNDHDEPVTVYFSPRDGLTLRVQAGAFLPNYLRAVAMILVYLLLLVAVGVTCSTLFSTPVAALLALAVAIVLRAADFVATLARDEQALGWHDGNPAGAGVWSALLRLTYRGLDLVLAPLQTGRPLDDAATGVWVNPALLVHHAVVQVLVYGGLLALLSTVVFNRRELARPSA